MTRYSYDARNRLQTRGYADGKNDTFAYDRASRLTRAATARYDARGDGTLRQGSAKLMATL